MDTTEFIDRVRQATQLADSDEDWTPTQILREATQCLYERFTQPIVTARSGYWLQVREVLTIPGQSFYRIPPRAVVQGFELFCMTPSTSTNPTNWRQLAILTNAQSVEYMGQTGGGSVPSYFSLETDGVVLYPTPQEAMPLHVKYYLRPGELVEVPTYDGYIVRPETAQVTTLAEPDITNLPWEAGSYVDIVNTNGTSEAIAVNLLIADVIQGVGQSIVYLTEPLTDRQVQQVNATGRATMVTRGTLWSIPLPQELHSALVSYTAAVILVDKGDAEKAAQLVSRCEAAVKAILDVMTPRGKTRPFVFKTRNSFLRRRAGWQSGRY